MVRRVLCPPKSDTALRHASLGLIVDHGAGQDGSGGRVRDKIRNVPDSCEPRPLDMAGRVESRGVGALFTESRRLLVRYAEIWRSFYRVSLRAFRTFRRVISSATSWSARASAFLRWAALSFLTMSFTFLAIPCFLSSPDWSPAQQRNWSHRLLAVSRANRRDFVLFYFCRVARQSDFDGAVYEIAIADVVQHGFKQRTLDCRGYVRDENH